MKTKWSSICHVALFVAVLCSCSSHQIEITDEYIINPNWNTEDNSLAIHKMVSKDSTLKVDPNSISGQELFNLLIIDTSFSYRANVHFNGEKYSTRKVYFNKDNNFLWMSNPYDTNSARSILGELSKNTWYRLDGLSPSGNMYYLYLDQTGKRYVFAVYAMTNY